MLNAYALPDDVDIRASESRGRMLQTLAFEFENAFADIKYEIDTKTRTVNAQAFCSGTARFVRVYGGFAYHPLVSEDALVFTLLHETGHHRARGYRFAGDPNLACDCFADKWAIGAGAKALRLSSGRVMNLSLALESLDTLVMSIPSRHISASPRRRSERSQACWAAFWSMRRLLLSSCSAPKPTGPCYYFR
jgi:hypothetical protein